MLDLGARLRRVGLWLIWRMDGLLVPGIAIPFANHSLRQQFDAYASNRGQAIAEVLDRFNGWPESAEEAKTAYEQELDRRETIERKAVSLVSATGVASGLITAAGVIGILVPQGIMKEGQIAVGTALLVPLVSFVIGFLLAVLSWRVGRVELVGPSTIREVSSHPQPGAALTAERIVATELNQRLTLIRANYLDAAERWIMRGTLFVALAALTLLILATTTGVLTPDALPQTDP
jgi:hypothetical protein